MKKVESEWRKVEPEKSESKLKVSTSRAYRAYMQVRYVLIVLRSNICVPSMR